MSPELGAVGFLGFDIFGTIVDWRSGIARATAPFLGAHGIPLDPYSFADEWRALYQPAMQRVRSGERPWTVLDALHRENLEILLSRHGVDPGAVQEMELARLIDAWWRLDPWPDAVEGLNRLKKRFVIGALSNGHIAGVIRQARFGNLPWDVITGAETAHTYKPMPEVYLRSVAIAGFLPEQTAMVAAHNSDLKAAREVGLRTIFVRRPREHGPAQTIDIEPECNWDMVADSLVEVAEALGCD